MKRLLLAIVVLGCARTLAAQFAALKAELQFQAAQTLSVTDIIDIPAQGVPVGNGTVVLEALITETGKVGRIEVRRDLGHFTEVAVHAVEDWKFSAATMGGKPITSRMPVAVNFRPPFWNATPAPLPPLIPQTEAAIQAEFQPVEVLRAAYPNYPSSTLAVGTVVLEVAVSEAGKAAEMKVLRDLPPLTDAAKAAVTDWQFMAATLNGVPVRSKIVLVFVFPAIALQYWG